MGPAIGDTICGSVRIDAEAAPAFGSGVFGSVREATMVDTGTRQWLTVIERTFLPSHKDLSRFMAGANALTELQHPAFLQVGLVDREADFCVVGFDPLPGARPLAELVDNRVAGPLVDRVAVELARGLAVLHRLGRLHGSLTTGSVLVWEGIPKIWQHGLAELCAASRFAAQAIRVDPMLAPEVRAGHPLRPSADVFAWGVLVAEIVVGRRGPAAVAAVLEAREQRAEQSHLLGLVRAALEPDPKARPQDGHMLLRLLHQAPSVAVGLADGAGKAGIASLRELAGRYLEELEHLGRPDPAHGPMAPPPLPSTPPSPSGLASSRLPDPATASGSWDRLSRKALGGPPGVAPPSVVMPPPAWSVSESDLVSEDRELTSKWRPVDVAMPSVEEPAFGEVESGPGVDLDDPLAGLQALGTDSLEHGILAGDRELRHFSSGEPSHGSTPNLFLGAALPPEPFDLLLEDSHGAPQDRSFAGSQAGTRPSGGGRGLQEPSARSDSSRSLAPRPGAPREGSMLPERRPSQPLVPPPASGMTDRITSPRSFVAASQTMTGPKIPAEQLFPRPRPRGRSIKLAAIIVVSAALVLALGLTLRASIEQGGLPIVLGLRPADPEPLGVGEPDSGVGSPSLEGQAESEAPTQILNCPDETASIGRVGDQSVCIDVAEYPGLREVPRVGVTLAEAAALCGERGRRLCSQREWRRACRGSEGARAFPYGHEHRQDRCNEASSGGVAQNLSRGGARDECRTAEGLFDLVGNVAEWVDDGEALGGDATTSKPSCATRAKLRPTSAGSALGFRCCLTLHAN